MNNPFLRLVTNLASVRELSDEDLRLVSGGEGGDGGDAGDSGGGSDTGGDNGSANSTDCGNDADTGPAPGCTCGTTDNCGTG
jgi:hypothetical protein